MIISSLLKAIASINIWQIWLPEMIRYTLTLKGQALVKHPLLLLTKTILYSWLVLMTLRCLLIGLISPAFQLDLTTYFHFDLVVKLSTEALHFFDPTTALAFSLSPIYGLYVDYAVYFGFASSSLEFFYDIIVRNSEDFFQCNPQLVGVSPATSHQAIRPIVKMVHFIRSWRQIWQGKVLSYALQFKHSQLVFFPHISKKLRAKAVLMTLASSYNIVFSCLVFFLVYLLTAVLFCVFILPQLSLPQKILVLADLTIMLYAAWNANRMGLMGLSYVNIPKFIYCSHMANLNQKLAKLNQSYRIGEKVDMASLVRYLEFFQHEHVNLVKNVLILMSFVSTWLFIAFISQVTLNIWLVCAILFKKLLIGEKIILYSLIVIQIYLGSMTCHILINVSEALHSSAKFLYQSQLLLSLPSTAFSPALVGHLRAKLKLLHYYEILNTRKKICFSLGPLGSLSQHAIFEFCFVYSAYLMTASGIVMASLA